MNIVKAIDVASFQPTDLSAIIAEYRPRHVIVHLYTAIESPPWEHSARQVESALANGCTVGGYVFLYPGTNHVRAINSAMDRCASIGLVLPILWLDVETFAGADLTPAELRTAVSHCDALGVTAGLYTSRYMWGRIGNPAGFEHLPVWLAQYDGIPDLSVVTPPPNLPNVAAKQYRGDPLDLNVILEEYTRPPAQPVPDPCETLRTELLTDYHRRPYKPITRRRLKALLGV